MLRIASIAAALAALVLTGCSLKQSSNSSSQAGGAPAVGAQPDDKKATDLLGFPITATRNTTRVTGSDPIADAAGVASAVYPAASDATRPPAVALVDKGDWQVGIAASQLSAPPVRAPVLLTAGDSTPAVTSETLARLKPKGSALPGDAQAVLVGDKPPAPDKLKSTVIRGSDPYELAAAVDRFASVAKGKPSPDVIVASGEQSGYAMPAAAWAGRSGDAVLFAKKDELPAPTRRALIEHQKPKIYVLGPPSVISDAVVKQLSALGPTKRVGGPTPVENSVAFARYQDGAFGFGATVPGQNLTVANTSRPLDATAAAPLASNGIFAPLVLTDTSSKLPLPLEGYLLDIQPGFEGGGPSRSQGVYNHVWIMGGSGALSPAVQDRIDQAAALIPAVTPGTTPAKPTSPGNAAPGKQ